MEAPELWNLLKVKNKDTRETSKQISYIVIVFPLLTVN